MAGALTLAACGGQSNEATNETAASNAASIDTGTAAVPPESLALPARDNAVVEAESTAPAIQVAEVPTPAPAAPATDSAPLTEATAAEQLIAAGTGITRVQQADGWAWMQDGQIIRTASADGHRVSYFKRGSTTPYFVQQDDRSYAYDNGRLSHEYDNHGRIQKPDAQHQREAQQFADQARQLHERAQQASKTAPHVERGHAGTTTPATEHPSSSHQPGTQQRPGSEHQGRGQDGRPGNAHQDTRPTPTPAPATHDGSGARGDAHTSPRPTPTPTARSDEGRRSSDDHNSRGSRDDRRSGGG